jgi:cell division cycle 14
LFSVEKSLVYESFADDFGPLNLASVFKFCQILDRKIEESPARIIVMDNSTSVKSTTNAVFLLGAYLIMRRDYTVSKVVDTCMEVMRLIVTYRDVSPGLQNFFLRVQDCWGGLWRARSLQWVHFDPDGFDLEEYENYDSPLNADLHEIIPGKFIAMRGPKELPHGQLFEDMSRSDGSFSHREFSPAHYADILRQFDVQLVVRLNAPRYNARAMEAADIAVADLFFEDCTAPPVDVVAKFLAIAEALPGALAVHCKAGLGRTGTLIALYMMKHHDFTAREAMGWLRIVRPGSVIGEQQDFLCTRESLMRRTAPGMLAGGAAVADGAGAAAVARAVQEITEAYDARYSAALRTVLAHPPLARSRTGPLPEAGRAAENLRRTGSCADLAEHVSLAAERRSGARVRGAEGGPGRPAGWAQSAAFGGSARVPSV